MGWWLGPCLSWTSTRAWPGRAYDLDWAWPSRLSPARVPLGPGPGEKGGAGEPCVRPGRCGPLRAVQAPRLRTGSETCGVPGRRSAELNRPADRAGPAWHCFPTGSPPPRARSGPRERRRARCGALLPPPQVSRCQHRRRQVQGPARRRRWQASQRQHRVRGLTLSCPDRVGDRTRCPRYLHQAGCTALSQHFAPQNRRPLLSARFTWRWLPVLRDLLVPARGFAAVAA